MGLTGKRKIACVAGGIVCGARLKFWRRSRVPKTGIRDAYFSRLRRQISLDYYTIPPATQASVKRPKI